MILIWRIDNGLFPRIQVLWLTALSGFSNTCPSVLLHTQPHSRIYLYLSAECFCSASWKTVIRKCYICHLFTLFARPQGSNRLVLCPVNAEWGKIIRQLLRAWISGPGESDTEKWGSSGRSCFQTLLLLRSLGYFTLKTMNLLSVKETWQGDEAALKD